MISSAATIRSSPAVSLRGRVAGERLTRALLNLGAQELRTHCSDPASHHLWLSEYADERASAAEMCIGCPVLTECDRAATARLEERFGVWGGVDYTKRQGEALPAEQAT
jgi:Transcription factor WhiB